LQQSPVGGVAERYRRVVVKMYIQPETASGNNFFVCSSDVCKSKNVSSRCCHVRLVEAAMAVTLHPHGIAFLQQKYGMQSISST
jgi:hypothetical protein